MFLYNPCSKNYFEQGSHFVLERYSQHYLQHLLVNQNYNFCMKSVAIPKLLFPVTKVLYNVASEIQGVYLEKENNGIKFYGYVLNNKIGKIYVNS